MTIEYFQPGDIIKDMFIHETLVLDPVDDARLYVVVNKHPDGKLDLIRLSDGRLLSQYPMEMRAHFWTKA